MLKAVGRWWRYLGASLGTRLEQTADPKVQLEQAIADAREQHRLLVEQAANVIANQTQLEARLDRAIEDYGNVNGSARRAVLGADQAQSAGDPVRVQTMTVAARGLVGRAMLLEQEIESLKHLMLDATAASERARKAVAISSAGLQRKLVEREALMSRLDQAKMQEQVNAAMSQLAAGVGSEAPTLEEVRAKIEHRLAAAQAIGEVGGSSSEMLMLEVEQAQLQAQTDARLADLQAELGIKVSRALVPALPEPGVKAADVPVAAVPASDRQVEAEL